jgi:hypothetical protein
MMTGSVYRSQNSCESGRSRRSVIESLIVGSVRKGGGGGVSKGNIDRVRSRGGRSGQCNNVLI